MSDPIEHRLRDSLSRHAAAATPTADGWTAIRDRAERADRLFARRRRTFRLAAAGALAALVAVAVPLTLDRIRSDDDIAFEPPPPITAETATPTPSPTATEPTAAPSASPTPVPTADPAADPAWTVVDDGGVLAPGSTVRMSGAAALGSRVVAVGSFIPATYGSRAAVWLADDGVDWRLVDDPEAFGGPDANVQALAVAATRRGFVAVGTGYYGDEADLAVAWTSPDGTSWERTDLPGDGRATAVTEAAGGRLVAVGQAIGSAPAIWTSADGGGTWDNTVLDLYGDEGTLPDGGTLQEVVAVGDRVVALGGSSVVISEDGGGSWTQVTLEEAGLDPAGFVESLVVLDDGSLLAVITTDAGPTAQRSADGSTWEPPVALPPSSRGGLDRVEQVIVLDDGALLAVGVAYDPTGFDPEGIVGSVAWVWTSADGGRSWVWDDSDIADGQGGMTAVAATADTLVAVGEALTAVSDGLFEEAGGRAWRRPLP